MTVTAHYKNLFVFMIVSVMLFAGAGPARADITFYTGVQGGNQGTQNVVFNGVNDVLAGMTIVGHLSDDTQVSFFGGQEHLFVPAGGQARIEASDGGFTGLEIFLTDPPGGTFSKVIFNLDALANGKVTIGVVEGNGASAAASFDLDKNGNNFFTTIAVNGQDIRTITIASTVDLEEIAQVRLGGGSVPAPVPEPASVILLGTTFVGLAVLRKRWAKRA